MTDEGRGVGGTVGPPWSVDVLADLHAWVLDGREAAELWLRVDADPDARAIIEALNATTGELAGLATAPAEPMPAEFAAGWTPRCPAKHGNGEVSPPSRPWRA